MSVLIKPILRGTAAACISLFVLWQISIFAIFMVGIDSTAMLFISVVSALLIGGYAAVKNLQGQSRLTYLVIGGLVAVIPIIPVALILVNAASKAGFDLWVVPTVVVVGIVSSISGSYIGSIQNIANMQKKP